jgi:hypothetical protein
MRLFQQKTYSVLNRIIAPWERENERSGNGVQLSVGDAESEYVFSPIFVRLVGFGRQDYHLFDLSFPD